MTTSQQAFGAIASGTRAIASVLRQSFQDFEIIIIDDASDDDTRAAVASQPDVRIRYFRHAENRGEAASRPY